MNAYFLEYLISSTSILLILIIGALIILLLNQNLRIKNFEQKIQESTNDVDILQKVFFNTKTPYVVVNENGIITNINNNALKLLNTTSEDIIGSVFDSFVVIQSSTLETKKLNESIYNKTTYDFETNLRYNNQLLNCILKITGILQGNQARYLIGIFLNNDSKDSEHENNLRDERINRLEETANIGFFVFDHETNDTRWSRGMYKLLGAKINERKPSLDFVSQIKTNNEELQNLILSIQDMKSYTNKIKIQGDDGVVRLIELDLTHQEGIDHSGGTTLGTLKYINSIENIFENFSISDEDLNLINNPKFFHLPKSEIIGKQISEIYNCDFSEIVNNPKVFSKTISYNDETVFLRKLNFDLESSEIELYIAFPIKSTDLNVKLN